MDFNNEEFGNVSDRLEKYASQVGALQARLECQEKMSEQELRLRMMEDKPYVPLNSLLTSH
jgi:hypothetical protein